MAAPEPGPVRLPIRLRRRTDRALDETLWVRFPGAFRRGAALTLRLPTRSRLRQTLLARAVRVSYQAQNRSDWVFTLNLYSDDCELRNVAVDYETAPGIGEVYRGREGVRRFLQQWTEPWQHWRYEPKELIDLADGRFLVLADVVGLGKGSGAEVREPLAQLVEVEEGQIVRQRNWLGGWEGALLAADLPARPEAAAAGAQRLGH